MYSFKPISVRDVLKEKSYLTIFESLRINGMEVGDIVSYLSHTPLMEVSYNDTHLGILSVEPSGELCIEVHAYVLPQHRKHSMKLLKAFRDDIYRLTPFDAIRTTVTGDVWPLVRFLSFIGFEVMDIEDNVVNKGGKLYDLYHLQHNKEINNG